MKKETLLVFFNLGVAFGIPTRVELDAFLKGHREDMEVERCAIMPGFEVPTKITLKNEAVRKDWEEFLKKYEISEGTSEESVAVEEGSSVGDSFKLMPLEALEKLNIKEHTPEQLRSSFERYSRMLSHEELCLASESGIKMRIVDFDSIVNGLTVVEKYAVNGLKSDKPFFKLALEELFDLRNIKNTCTVKICDKETRKTISRFSYSIEPEHIENFRELFKTTLEKMCKHPKVCETLILSVVLLKNLKLAISTRVPSCVFEENTIYFQFYDSDAMNVGSLYHELNHFIHHHLGLIEGKFSIVGNLNSKLEDRLFQFGLFSDRYYKEEDEENVSEGLLSFLVHDCYWTIDDNIITVSKSKLCRVAQLRLLWNSLEELWNIIGFANVDNCIYVNRMSDLNLLQRPRWFHDQLYSFTDFSPLPKAFTDTNLERYRDFCEEMESRVNSKILTLCPAPEAWNMWLRLQNREDAVKEGYTTMIDKTMRQLLELVPGVRLIESK